MFDLIQTAQELVVKEVSFCGAKLIAVQDVVSGKVYAGVKWMCEGIGFSKGQYQNERQRIQKDLVLSKGERNLVLPTKGGNQEVLCIEVKFIPLWLAKISLTPAMQRDCPEVIETLVQYQLEAAEVLAAAFVDTTPIVDVSQLPPDLQMFKTLFDNVARSHLEQEEIKRQLAITTEEVKATQATVENIKETIIVRDEDWRNWINQMFNRAVAKTKTKDYQVLRRETYEILEQRAHCRLDTRLANLKTRLEAAGATKTKLKETTKLDVIESEPRLKEIYTTIIKEMAVRFVA